MKSIMLASISILLITNAIAFSQSIPEFVIIDEIADDMEQLKSEFSGHPNVYVTDGITPNALGANLKFSGEPED